MQSAYWRASATVFSRCGAESREIALPSGLDPGGLRHRAKGGALLNERGRHAAVMVDGLSHLRHHAAVDSVQIGRANGTLGSIKCIPRLRRKEQIASEAGQGGDLLPRVFGAAGRHHGSRIPGSEQKSRSTHR